MKAALAEITHLEFHVVAQIIKTKFIVGTIGHIGVIGCSSFAVSHPMNNFTDAESQKLIDLAHPFSITGRQIIVNRYQMNPLACEGIEVGGQGGSQGLAFSGLHLGNPALMQNDPAYQLYIIMPLTQDTFCRLPHDGKGFRQKVIKGLAFH